MKKLTTFIFFFWISSASALSLTDKQISGYWGGVLPASSHGCTNDSGTVEQEAPMYLHLRVSKSRVYAIDNFKLKCTGKKLSKLKYKFYCPRDPEENAAGVTYIINDIVTYTFASRKSARVIYKFVAFFPVYASSCANNFKGTVTRLGAK